MNRLQKLFPKISPYDSGILQVSNLHSIYWEQVGKPDGIPVIVLHGGPGGGGNTDLRRFFNPDIFRIIIFDQRGCGRSLPHAEIKENTTQLLIQDIEAIRNMLKISRWHVWGGSWGSTLALAYAQAHPENSISLILRGIFLMRQQEINWFLGGMKHIFPEVWDNFVNFLPESERSDILENYYQQLINPDPNIHISAAQHWSAYEGAFSHLQAKQLKPEDENAKDAVSIARIEAHYFRNNLFQPDNKLLQNLNKIHHIPCSIIQGRYDIVCPAVTAWELHKNYPNSKYHIINDAGHASNEPKITDCLISCMTEHANYT